jgi:ribonuclease HI
MKFLCDGACNPNPGPMGIGVAMFDPAGELVATISRAIGEGTNNLAEFQAVLAALELARTRDVDAPIIFTDSQLVVEQIHGRYNVAAKHLQALRDRAASELRKLRGSLSWIPREENTVADRLSKRALAPANLPPVDVVAAQLARVLQFLGNEKAMREVAVLAVEFIENEPERVEEALLAARFGESRRDSEDLARFNARIRHGAEGLAAMEAALVHRSPATRLKALRWAARGFLPSLVEAKLRLEKALSAPFMRP